MIDLTNLQPNKVSTDAKSYSLLMIGEPKIGKSTFMQELYGERTLFIATEKRFGTMDGAYIQYVSDWVEFQQAINQLKKKEVHEMFDNVVVDTLDNLGRYSDDYVASQFDENVLGENASFGADYNRAEINWERAMKKIENSGLNYSAVVHSKEVNIEVPLASLSEEDRANIDKSAVRDGVVTITKKVADLPNRYNKHIEKSFDNVVFADYGINKSGENMRVLYLRGGMKNGAKVTLKDVPDVIPFTTEDLQKAFKKSLGSYSNKTDKKKARSDIKDADYNYEELMEKAKELSKQYVALDKVEVSQKVVEDTLGKGVTVGSLTPNRVKELALVIDALTSELKKLK